MRILVTSDSHDNYRALAKAAEAAEPYDAFIFLGDGDRDFDIVTRNMAGITTYRVRGNNDWSSNAPLSLVADIGTHKFFITHGTNYGLWQGYDKLLEAANTNGCQAVLFGHTHSRHYSFEKGIHLFNPGSVSLPRDSKPCSYGIITEEKGKLDFFHFDVK